MYIHYDGKEYERVDAAAIIKGSASFPKINGLVRFYQTDNGVYIVTSVTGLPKGGGACDSPIFAMHIHDGDSCAENGTEPFPFTGTHFNPNDCAHPEHAGDLPPLFGCHGIAMSAVLTDRFTVSDILGKTVVIHERADDFKTQPSGDSGAKIACGVIQ